MALGAQAFDWDAATTTQRLHGALNLGWSMAELRGRLRYGHHQPPGTVDYQFARELHALPLDGEHSTTEQLIATRVAVSVLADGFGVDRPFDGVDEQPSSLVKALARALERALDTAEAQGPGELPRLLDDYSPASDVGRAWDRVADVIYRWDEQVQDRFSVSVELLSAYQLGRGLAEVFWALDPAAPSGQEHPTDSPRPCSWEFLLGAHRRDLLAAHLKRLEGLLPTMSVPAVKGSLARWTQLVTTGDVRSHADAATALRAQLQLWRDVLLGARNPFSLVKSLGVGAGARQFRRVLEAFGLELALAAFSIAALAVAGYYLGADKASSGWSVAVSILGFFGVTGASVLARAKTQTRALYAHLRDAFYQDVISEKATILPKGVKS
jgi:hypothetical protein